MVSGASYMDRSITVRIQAHERRVPYNNEMKQTKPAMAKMARSSLLILVFYGLRQRRS